MSVRPAKTQNSLGIRPVYSESLLCAYWVAKDPRFLHADSEDSDQIGRMPRLIWVFAGRTLTLLFCHVAAIINLPSTSQPETCLFIFTGKGISQGIKNVGQHFNSLKQVRE